jgi:hypothetical protein
VESRQRRVQGTIEAFIHTDLLVRCVTLTRLLEKAVDLEADFAAFDVLGGIS